jgi:hypothetical protein
MEVRMKSLRIIGVIIALSLGASAGAAQQSPTPPRNPHRGEAGGGKMSMMMVDSLNHRLDSLVAEMNRTSGDKKVTAMAAVITELVAQRKAMQNRMHQMMQGEGGKMGMMKDSTSPGAKPTAKPDSEAADTSDHAAHHPSK